MPSNIVFDVSHLVTRLTVPATTGIDRVDLAYARHLLNREDPCLCTQYGFHKPHILGRKQGARLLNLFERVQRENETSENSEWKLLLGRLTGSTPGSPPPVRVGFPPWDWLPRFARQSQFRVFFDWNAKIPKGAIYLSVAQHAFEHDRFFRWLNQRRDVRPVFFIHDLLPLDYPEFFPAGYRDKFLRRVKTMQRAFALITSSQSVASRIEEEFAKQSKRKPQILVEPLPSPLETSPSMRTPVRIGVPYFLMIGTIEPRKNHDLLLHIWRTLADRPDFRAKLVLVGKQGWETEQTMRELDLTPELQGRVLRVSGLSPAHMKELIGGALAVLMPSFAEGYGLPIVEALSVQTPVVCSDIPVFREVSQGKARFRRLFDGLGWREDILAIASPTSSLRLQLVSQARQFVAPTWRSYFYAVDSFLSSLKEW